MKTIIIMKSNIIVDMRSVQVSKANGPLELVERDIPEPSARQVRIKVQACGVCHSDSFTKEGLFPGIQYPRVPGHESPLVGTVAMMAHVNPAGVEILLLVKTHRYQAFHTMVAMRII